MHLTSITHRKQLFELATRWFGDAPRPGDGRFLTQVFTYENIITAGMVRALLTGIKDAVHPGPIQLRRLQSKDELRDAILGACPDPSPREAELFRQYRQRPEEFFPGTPSDVVLGLRADSSILGMARVKRLRRIAEKCSRRVADALAGTINDRARAVALRHPPAPAAVQHERDGRRLRTGGAGGVAHLPGRGGGVQARGPAH